ncbi:hypothetical protein GGS23DRAFT_569258 [Durotheca rogersii]|uniref:uncharacterized protein n=1 Tax=Durotheca rogersii TaxID=419775 RepID=UPI00222101E0|nr:uncharacterized protein GGS23DRAFT_569258 [Durotheca rogersii]KAI5862748.1 hypothetical protein GGS23DRAFT_569258 [Durotheca rogersii]
MGKFFCAGGQLASGVRRRPDTHWPASTQGPKRCAGNGIPPMGREVPAAGGDPVSAAWPHFSHLPFGFPSLFSISPSRARLTAPLRYTCLPSSQYHLDTPPLRQTPLVTRWPPIPHYLGEPEAGPPTTLALARSPPFSRPLPRPRECLCSYMCRCLCVYVYCICGCSPIVEDRSGLLHGRRVIVDLTSPSRPKWMRQLSSSTSPACCRRRWLLLCRHLHPASPFSPLVRALPIIDDTGAWVFVMLGCRRAGTGPLRGMAEAYAGAAASSPRTA